MKMKAACILITLSLVPILASAAPLIINLSTSVITDGITLTISGSEFTNKLKAAPLKWDDFEKNGTGYEDGDPITNDGWAKWSSYAAATYETNNTRPGSTKHFFRDETSNVRGSFWDSGRELSTVYISYWVRYNLQSTSGDAPQIKWFRVIHSTTSGSMESAVTNIMQWGMNVSTFNIRREDGTYTSGISDDSMNSMPSGVWVRHEHWYVASSAANRNDGKAEVWAQTSANGKFSKQISGTNITTNTSTNAWSTVWLGEYSKQCSYTLEFDDVYIDTTQARVEVGNASSWDNCTHREIQIPTEWSDGSISFNFNQGSFKGGEYVYIFVVDSNGNPSDGYGPVQVGGLAGGDDPDPQGLANPQGLKIVQTQ